MLLMQATGIPFPWGPMKMWGCLKITAVRGKAKTFPTDCIA